MAFRTGIVSLILLMVVGCGGGERRSNESAAEPPRSDAPAASSATATANQPFAFTDEDLAAYARGIAREIELVKAAQQQASTAKTANQRGEAIQAQWETATVPEAARQIGIDVDRYRRTREAVHEVFKTLDFQGKIDGPLSIDLSRVDEATRARISRDPFNDLPPASAAALRAKMSELVPLWSEYTKLTAVAG